MKFQANYVVELSTDYINWYIRLRCQWSGTGLMNLTYIELLKKSFYALSDYEKGETICSLIYPNTIGNYQEYDCTTYPKDLQWFCFYQSSDDKPRRLSSATPFSWNSVAIVENQQSFNIWASPLHRNSIVAVYRPNICGLSVGPARCARRNEFRSVKLLLLQIIVSEAKCVFLGCCNWVVKIFSFRQCMWTHSIRGW